VIRGTGLFLRGKTAGFCSKSGHIKGAVNLPTLQVYTKDGTFKDKAEIEAFASGVVGKDLSKEIINYCDSGKVATVWSFLLSELLGYRHVKDYDGSAEEWTKDPKAPVEP